ncbi:MAG: hypothetical protein B6I26_02250 [Desulfobacteraceae bacterium 4572_130]|nr:MAG: hypothetical protein B6I26_02250 [Desulfobacteraceae bacterium 4572_130]
MIHGQKLKNKWRCKIFLITMLQKNSDCHALKNSDCHAPAWQSIMGYIHGKIYWYSCKKK